jgi:hypothetical protein
MCDPTQSAGGEFTFDVRPDRFWHLQIEGELTPALTDMLLATAQQKVNEQGPARGLLLDVRRCAPLSMVRVSALVEGFSYAALPLAVVFLWEQQQELASLLHHTLPNRENIAYFTALDRAWAFLESHTP